MLCAKHIYCWCPESIAISAGPTGPVTSDPVHISCSIVVNKPTPVIIPPSPITSTTTPAAEPLPVQLAMAPPLFRTQGGSSSFSGHLHYYSCPFSTPSGLHCLGALLSPGLAIPDAGHGLPRSKGTHLIDYLGEVLSVDESRSLLPALSSSLFIDSALTVGLVL